MWNKLQHLSVVASNPWDIMHWRSFVFIVCPLSLCRQLVSSSLTDSLHTFAEVCVLFVPSSSPCLMRTLSDSLRLQYTSLLSLHFFYLPALPLRRWVTRTKNSSTTTTGTFASKNDLRILHTVLNNDVPVRLWATIRSHHNCVTTRKWCSVFFEICTFHVVAWWFRSCIQ